MKRVLSIGLFSTAISLFAVHGLFHLWEWLWWPPPDALQVLYGSSEAGRLVHAVTEAIVVLALVLGLKESIEYRLKVARQRRGLALLLSLAKYGPGNEKVRDPSDKSELPRS